MIRDWLNQSHTYWRVRIKLRSTVKRLKTRAQLLNLKSKIVYWRIKKRWTEAKLEFWKTLAGVTTPTPEQSEVLTGIEVTDDEE